MVSADLCLVLHHVMKHQQRSPGMEHAPTYIRLRFIVLYIRGNRGLADHVHCFPGLQYLCFFPNLQALEGFADNHPIIGMIFEYRYVGVH